MSLYVASLHVGCGWVTGCVFAPLMAFARMAFKRDFASIHPKCTRLSVYPPSLAAGVTKCFEGWCGLWSGSWLWILVLHSSPLTSFPHLYLGVMLQGCLESSWSLYVTSSTFYYCHDYFANSLGKNYNLSVVSVSISLVICLSYLCIFSLPLLPIWLPSSCPGLLADCMTPRHL